MESTRPQNERPFCVYLTVFLGNNLPPFYIGSTDEQRIARGYVGSVQSKRYRATWRHERQKHPEKFRVHVIGRYASRIEAFEREKHLQIALSAVQNPLYANLSLGHKDTAGGWNKGVPAWNKGRTWSAETRARISASKKNPSQVTRDRMSAANKGKRGAPCPEWLKEKLRSERLGKAPASAGWSKGKTGVYSVDGHRAHAPSEARKA